MILRAEKLHKSFGGLTAVHDVNLQIQEKELVSIIGPNGAGKTTLFNLLTGHLPVDSGRIFFQEKEITRLPPHTISRMGIGRSFQRLNIFPRLSAFENIQVAVFSAQRQSRNLFSRASKLARRETEAILDSVGLLDKKEVKGGLLAHGDQKRLEMGIALAVEPNLLLLDEPTQGMSPRESAEITRLIQKLVKEKGLTLIFVEHDMNVVFGISDSIKVLHQGRIIFEGKPEEVKNNEEVQRIYLGEEKDAWSSR
ncbi:MAG: ABC transporter ATP-binding protein [Deltaproteobacteria bacterium]|nr:ABC transporter ATP-binding protein [Deltaproteobacteria bacterium]